MPLHYTRKDEAKSHEEASKKEALPPEAESPRSTDAQPNNPLHGVKLADIVTELVERYGWEALGDRIPINCFTNDPSVKSSLKFLRRTPWAREKVEQLYLRTFAD